MDRLCGQLQLYWATRYLQQPHYSVFASILIVQLGTITFHFLGWLSVFGLPLAALGGFTKGGGALNAFRVSILSTSFK